MFQSKHIARIAAPQGGAVVCGKPGIVNQVAANHADPRDTGGPDPV